MFKYVHKYKMFTLDLIETHEMIIIKYKTHAKHQITFSKLDFPKIHIIQKLDIQKYSVFMLILMVLSIFSYYNNIHR